MHRLECELGLTTMFQVEQLLLLYFTFKGCQQQILKLWNFMVYIFNKIKNLFKNIIKVPSFETMYKMKNYFTNESIEDGQVSVFCDTKDHCD